MLKTFFNSAKSMMVMTIIVSLVAQLSCSGQTMVYPNARDSALYNKILRMNFPRYFDKPVNTFFSDLNSVYVKYTLGMSTPGYINRVIFIFSDSLSIDVSVKDLNQKEPLNFNYKFDLEVFKTKKINWLCLRYGGLCIKGCEYHPTCN